MRRITVSLLIKKAKSRINHLARQRIIPEAAHLAQRMQTNIISKNTLFLFIFRQGLPFFKKREDFYFFLRYWLVVYLYAGLIFYFSSFSNPPLPGFVVSDKLLHLIEYAVFAFLLMRAFSNSLAFSRRGAAIEIKDNALNIKVLRIVAILFVFLYGVSDELHQYFVPGRICSPIDAVFNFFGAYIGAYLYK